MTFAWTFQVSPIVSIVDLKRVAPPGVLKHEVLVTIAPAPRYHIDGPFSPPGS